MSAQTIPILLVTANVGSIFEDVISEVLFVCFVVDFVVVVAV